MSRVIRADLRRIFRKKGFLILMIVLFFIQLIDLTGIEKMTVDEIVSKSHTRMNGLVLLFATIFPFLSVVADDKRSNVWAAEIGIGLSRMRLLFTKILTGVILLTVVFGLQGAFRGFLFRLLEAPLSVRQLRLFALYCGLIWLEGVASLILCMLVEALSGSTPLAILADVLLVLSNPLGLALSRMYGFLNYNDFLIGGLVEGAYKNIAVGRFAWQLIPALAVYVGLAFAALVAVYRKKELQL